MNVLDDRTFNDLARLMHKSVGLSFSPAKKSLVSSRLANRIAHLGLGGYSQYLELIADAQNQDEFQSPSTC